MKKIIGIRNNKGEFNGRPYSNYHLFVQIDSKENCVGTIVEVIKVKSPVLKEWCERNKLPDLNAALGRNIEVFYDQYKNVSVINNATL